MMRPGPYVELTRPFTLLPPLLGMGSGAAAAIGAGANDVHGGTLVLCLVFGGLAAALLNGASNTLNQVEDLRLDAVNKPNRPLPRGAVGVPAARRFALLLYALAVAAAGVGIAVRTDGHELAVIVVFTAFLTWAYSSPPLRLRDSFWGGPLVIAIPRGGLLKVAGWAAVAPVSGAGEPWVLALVFFVFVLGCAPIKDFDDMEGDRAGGASSLPLALGPARAALVMAPFFVLPWILLALSTIVLDDVMSLDTTPTLILATLLSAHGAWLAWTVHRAAAAGRRLGRAAWRSLYVLMMEAQVGLAVLYLLL